MSETTISKSITYAVFLFSIGIIGISVISVIFPALIISQTYEFPLDLNPFEISPWALPILSTAISLFVFGFLHYKKKLPSSLSNGINFILNFEISRKISIILGLSILVIYIGFSIPELFIDEAEQWPDFLVLEEALNIWPSTDHLSVYVKEQNTRYVRMILLDFSQEFFQNIKLLPFVASIFTIVLTALITIQISKKRLAGIIAMLVLLSSVTFTDFDTIAVYENFWVLFYMISLYAIKKKWILSPLFYILSVFTKAYVAPFFIMTLYSVYRTTIEKKNKYLLFISYIGIIIIALSIIIAGQTLYTDIFELNFSKFFLGFADTAMQFRGDLFFIVMLLPMTIGLYMLCKNNPNADIIHSLIAGTIIFGPILVMSTFFYEILSYRYVPTLVFFSIGIGMFFAKKIK